MAQENSSPAYLAELLSKVGLGDRAAFSSLYQATSAKLFGLALRILLRRDLAEEALQDAFVKIWHNAESFNPEKAAAMTWMTTIVRNRCLDVLRASPHEAQLAEEQSFDDWASEDLGPLAEITASTEAKALMNCMSHLAPLQRQTIAMSYFHGLAHEQLAQQLVQPLGTIKTWIRRGLQVLKNCLTTA
ncbi:sigma-70 family RNA polymerase sigma factor [Methyloradius palustris]|uniref:RNA polymerase sigma factor n=1 Tax=Methyloradius palustris TaxID=2778876 RepID=A0A8D5JR57_9PROT|nr:sigma-70 family RNA polymerase sigma factor [Methyloradius palustris]BCM25136.1 RNA polymerase sigma factor [Methyloradius palustris]